MNEKSNKATTAARGGAPATGPAVQGTTRRARGRADEFKYRLLTLGQAEALVDKFIGTEDDDAAWAFIRLMHGIVARHLEHGDVEGVAVAAASRAYAKTIHSETAFEQFSMLHPGTPSDRILMFPGVAGVGK